MELPVVQRRLTPAAILATGLGIGLVMPAPGTFGTLWGVPIWLALQQIPSFPGQIVTVALLVAFGIPLCTRAAQDLARHGWSSTAKDPQAVVWDELATLPIVYLFAPIASQSLVGLLLGFGLHRLFDITKPWPCKGLENLPAGWGIMLDDVMAALYAGLGYAVLYHYL